MAKIKFSNLNDMTIAATVEANDVSEMTFFSKRFSTGLRVYLRSPDCCTIQIRSEGGIRGRSSKSRQMIATVPHLTGSDLDALISHLQSIRSELPA